MFSNVVYYLRWGGYVFSILQTDSDVQQSTVWKPAVTRMALGRLHTSAKTADVVKLLLLNKHQITQSFRAEYGDIPT